MDRSACASNVGIVPLSRATTSVVVSTSNQSFPRRSGVLDRTQVRCEVLGHDSRQVHRTSLTVLVLGGGGLFGEAWMTGVLAGYEDATGA